MADRRTLLTAAGLSLLAVSGASLAGCSSAASTSKTTGTGGTNGTTVATKDVPVGSGVVLGAFIVAQPASGTFKAFSSVCPHQGCAVDKIQGEQAVCPCHQSTFSLADGSRLSGPATSGLTAAKATVTGDTVSVSV